MIKDHRQIIRETKRCVIKIGSGILTDDAGVKKSFFPALTREIALLAEKGIEVVLVSSGAVACGMALLNWKKRPEKISEKQAAAALGQPLLMHHYSKAFEKKGLKAAQILLTREDLKNRHRYLTAKHAFTELFKAKAIPIVNENDSVAVEEIQVGDNDQLSALVAHLVDADLLLILTDIDGFYDSDPKTNPNAKRIPLVENVDAGMFASAQGTLSAKSVGGMVTKLKAASQAADYGVPTWLVSGDKPSILSRVFEAKPIGTLFLPKTTTLSSHKYWITHALKPAGEVTVDEGAAAALCTGKKSLLSSGITDVKGNFQIGDCITILSPKGNAIARGLVSYNAGELQRIKGAKSADIQKILGYKYADEIVNRDDLVVLGAGQ